jgi:hypothetical protein
MLNSKIWKKHGVICHNFASEWAEVPVLKIAFFRIKLQNLAILYTNVHTQNTCCLFPNISVW